MFVQYYEKRPKKDFLELSRKPLKLLILLTKLVARVTRLELATSGVTGQRSNQLSYTPEIFVWWAVTGSNR